MHGRRRRDQTEFSYTAKNKLSETKKNRDETCRENGKTQAYKTTKIRGGKNSKGQYKYGGRGKEAWPREARREMKGTCALLLVLNANSDVDVDVADVDVDVDFSSAASFLPMECVCVCLSSCG